MSAGKRLRVFQSKPLAAVTAKTDAAGLLADYPGAKFGCGIAQRIISQMPPHHTYVELFAGSAAVLRLKKPAFSSIAVDADAAVCSTLRALLPGTIVVCGDGIQWLKKQGRSLRPGTVLYCDPPYLATARSCQRDYYRCEFDTEAQHRALLRELCRLEPGVVWVLLSGYRSALYDEALKDWRRMDYTVGTHGGPATESLWCNGPEPVELYDWRFLGDNFRDRERIKRKLNRWRLRLAKMPPLERRLIASAIAGIDEEDRSAARIVIRPGTGGNGDGGH
jgi:hypothetical protein